MIPPTKNGLNAMACVSAMQKAIRRSLEVEAMQFAVELIHTSKAFNTMVLNRLVITAHEDIDSVAAPWVVPYVQTTAEVAKALYSKAKNPENPGGARMLIGNMIRIMCAAPKSRVADHFQASLGLAELVEKFVPEIPDWAKDKHTIEGKKMGRGLDHFRAEGALLINPDGEVVADDRYAEEAYRLWALRRAQRAEPAAGPLFDPGNGKGRNRKP